MDDESSVQRGLELLAQRQPVKALECFVRALDENPDNIAALAGKARALLGIGEYQFAIGACDAALALDSRLLGVLGTRFRALVELRRYEEALTVTDAALVIDPDSPLAWQSKAAVLLQLGRPDEASLACDRALASDEDQMMAWRCKATALLQLGYLDDAKFYFDRILALLPDDEAAILGKAQIEAVRKRGILQGLAQAGYELLLALALSG